MATDDTPVPTGTALIRAATSTAFRAGQESGKNEDNTADARVDKLATFIVRLLGGLLVLSIIGNLVLAAMVLDAKLNVSKEGVTVGGSAGAP